MTFLATFELSSLDGSNGFIINGIDPADLSGFSVSSAGDVNGDGIDDLIIGAPYADPNGRGTAGESYVVFGRSSGFSASFNLSSLSVINGGDGSNGFIINGINGGDSSGISVSSAGDVNGDGIDDLIIGARDADPNGNRSGQSYVVFGSSNFNASFDLSSLNGSNGFVINGIDPNDRSGISVSSAGDVNGDGIDDLIIGAYRANPDGKSYAGESYVVFGRSSGFNATFNLSSLLPINGGNGSNGFVINGIDPFDDSGSSVSNAGDVNGDGIDDLIIGATGGDPNGLSSGESYIVFGSSSGFSGSFNLSSLNGTNGFVINGIDGGDRSGWSVSSAGDVNGDGIDDLIIGALRADPNGTSNAGESYVVFGRTSGLGSINLSTLNGSNGFIINGIATNDYSGRSVSGAGDVNGDGIDDLIIGAYLADPNAKSNAGESYVVFGRSSGFTASLNLSSLDGSNGFIIKGIDAVDSSGWSVSSAGDVNGDGIDDLIIGAINADPNGNSSAGESYVIFGQATTPPNQPPVAQNDSVTTDEDSLLTGNVFADNGNGTDSDPDGDPLIVTEVNGVANDVGTQITLASGALLTLNTDGTFSYDPNGQFESLNVGDTDNDSFTYTISDGNGSTATATVNVTINGVNDNLPPVAVDDGLISNFNLSNLNGSNGFIINGIDMLDSSGWSVSSAGDVNGDGIDDLIIGAPFADPNSNNYAGESYVVFGSSNFNASLDLSSLDGSNGFVINGIDAYDQSGRSVSNAGDINGDGIDDLIIGAPGFFYSSPAFPGESYVVFGSSNFNASLDLSSLNGSNGFVINGINGFDYSGYSVSSAGDINGDGIDDLIIGAFFADSNGNSYTGKSYVVFGSSSGFGSSLDLLSLNGSNGFVINGIDTDDQSGRSVSSAGDVNGDGIDELIIGAPGTDYNGYDVGKSYVVFGSSNFNASLNLSSLDGSNGFIINGIDERDLSGSSVSSAGDVNGDGIDDLIIGAWFADPNGNSYAGESYVVFGSSIPFTASFDLSSLDGSNGFVINGIDVFDLSGFSVSSAGDVNGDGIDDLIIGAPVADYTGESYVVFGNSSGFNASLNLSSLDGNNGFVINGIDAYDGSGWSVSSAGDVNGDGIDDLIIGALGAGSVANAGESYVVFGQRTIVADPAFTTNEDTAFTTGNVLVNDSEPNGDPLTVVSIDTTGTLGLVNGNGDGTFNYNPNGAFESLNNGDIATDSFTYTISDGNGGMATATVYLTINGVNDEAVISGNITGTAIEAGGINNSTAGSNATGDLNHTDVDNTNDVWQSVTTATLGDNGYGSYTINPNGTWTYFVDDSNTTVEALNVGDSRTDTFTALTEDDTTQLVTVTINGANDEAVISGDITGTAIEAGGINNVTLGSNATGDLNHTDVDNTNDVWQSVTTATVGDNGYGSYTINPNGTWTYFVDDSNTTVEALNVGDSRTDTFTALTEDGTAQQVTVSINGVNDGAVISGDITGTAIEAGGINNGTLGSNATGDLNHTDVDNTNDVWQNVTTATLGDNGYGSYTINPNGTWTYFVDDSNTTVEALNVGDSLTDTFTALTEDGTAQQVTVTINGVNDAPIGNSDAVNTPKNTAINIAVSTLLANDTDLDNPLADLRITGVSGATNGTVSLNNNGTPINFSDDFITFNPTNGFTGNTSFNYTVSDGNLTNTTSVLVGVGATFGTPNADNIATGNAADTIYTFGGNDTVNAGSGNDFVDGGDGNDNLIGGIGDDILLGGNGNDTLVGDNGNDFLRGGLGNDTVTGGNGTDTFVLAVGEGTDTFTDFISKKDLIGLADGLTFGQLSFSGEDILFGSEVLATLTGVNTNTLTVTNFVTV